MSDSQQYIVSARKYRPDSFEDLIGQDNIVKTLKNSIIRGKLAHAYLFCGPRGVGKTSAARIFAKIINCSNPSEDMEPCGQCESCVSFREGRSYCIHELDAASNNGVDDIKALMDQVQIPPQVGRYSVYIIDEVHMLTQAAFNSFLKTLEEPPAHAIFILATTEKHKILPTILSRCQTYDFNRISVEDIVRNLRMVAGKEGISIDDESLHVIAHKADGAMRDALTIFDQTVAFCGTDVKYADVIRNLNVLDYEYSFSLVEHFITGDYAFCLKTFDEILSKGFNALHFVGALSSHLRDLAVTKAGGLDSLLELPASLKSRYVEQAAKCSPAFIYEALGITTACESAYKAAINPRLHIEFALMRLCYLVTKPEGGSTAAKPAETPKATETAETPKATEAQKVAEAPKPAEEPQTRSRRSSRGGISMTGLMETQAVAPAATETTVVKIPSEDEIRAAWPKLAQIYASKPRLFNMLSNSALEFEESEGKRTVRFEVVNDAQKEWVETKLLHELEGNIRKIAGNEAIMMEVKVTPAEQKKNEAYMPSDKAKVLMAKNEEVKKLVKDFSLDIK